MATLATWLEEPLDVYAVRYRVHATRRMFERGVFGEDVERVLEEGEIIERYDDDLPLRRVLINGRGRAGEPLHVVAVVDLGEKRLTVITVYEPDPARWTQGFSRRRA